MLVTALLNLVASLIRSVLSRAFGPPAPDAAGAFSDPPPHPPPKKPSRAEVKPRPKHPEWEPVLR